MSAHKRTYLVTSLKPNGKKTRKEFDTKDKALAHVTKINRPSAQLWQSLSLTAKAKKKK